MDKLLNANISGRFFKAVITNFQRVLGLRRRLWNLKTLVIIAALVLSIVMAFALLNLKLRVTLALLVAIACCVLIIIEPYYGLCLLLILTILHPEHDRPNLEKLHLQRNFGMVTLVSWLVHAMKKKQKVLVMCPQTFLLPTLYTVMYISSFESISPEASARGLHEFGVLFLICFMMMSMVDTKERIRIIIWIVLITGFYLAYKGASSQAKIRDGGAVDLSEMNKNYGGTNALSMLMVALVPISWSMIFGESRRLFKIASVFTCGLYTITNLKTMSRGGFISFGIVIILMLITAPKKARIPTVVLCLALIILMTLMAPDGYFDEMRTIMSHEEQSSDVKRVELIQLGLEIVKSSPFFGIGIYNFNIASGGWASHNTYIQVLAELGYVGFSLFFLLIILTFWDFWKIGRMLKGRDKYIFFYSLSRGLQISMIGLLFRFFFINAAHLNISYIIIIVARLIRIDAEREYAGDNSSKVGGEKGLEAVL